MVGPLITIASFVGYTAAVNEESSATLDGVAICLGGILGTFVYKFWVKKTGHY